MPFESGKQRKYLYKNKPAVAAKFARHGKRPHNREDEGVFHGKDLKDGYRKILVPKRWDTELA